MSTVTKTKETIGVKNTILLIIYLSPCSTAYIQVRLAIAKTKTPKIKYPGNALLTKATIIARQWQY